MTVPTRSSRSLLGSLVDLCEETPKHLFLHSALLLIDSLNQRIDPLITLLLVRFKSLRNGDWRSGEDLLDASFGCRVFLPIVLVEDLTLFRRSVFEGDVDVP